MTLPRRHSSLTLVSRCLLIASLFLASFCVNAQESACRGLADWNGEPNDLEIDQSIYWEDFGAMPDAPQDASDLPGGCQIVASFEHRKGADGSDYAIRFVVNMPDNWNGSFVFQGGTGTNGMLLPALGNVATGGSNQSALVRGFAVARTDSGHERSAPWTEDQQAVLNFEYQANAKVTEVVRPIVENYYGSVIESSYFVGSSTGGREAMIMAQRYPDLFDGIISGRPAMRTGVSNLALQWVHTELRKVPVFTAEELSTLMGALMNRCDALDGQADGLIFNRNGCDFDARQIACSAIAGGSCLPDAKAEALARSLAGPVTSGGVPVYVPFPYDSGLDDDASIRERGLLIQAGNRRGDAAMEIQDVDAAYILALEQTLGDTATHYRLSTFIARGGKIIFFHGEGDPLFSANDTVRYYERMSDTNAEVLQVSNYARLYLVPGNLHGGGEQTVDNFDLLTPLVEWVESGLAPHAVVATGESLPGQSRPLCPYPEYAHYQGGDPASAESYACRND